MAKTSPMAKETTAESLLRMGSVSDAVLTDWTEELAGVDQGQRKTRARLLKCQQSLFLGPNIH